jgi:Trypsin-like peptidase domain
MDINAGQSPPPDATPPPLPGPMPPAITDPVMAAANGSRDDTLSDHVLASLARDWLTFERLRQALLAAGADDPLLLQASERDVGLIVHALFDPARPELQRELARVALYRALADYPSFAKLRFGIELPDRPMPGADQPEAGALQVMLAQDDVFARWQEFQLGMERIGAVICKISVEGNKSGTGFLVKDKLVLTAYHAVETLIDSNGKQRAGSREKLEFLFDDIIPNRGAFDKYRRKVAAAPMWLKACSQPDPRENAAPEPLADPDPDRLDFALIELDEPIGLTAPRYRKGVPRNWIDLDDLAEIPARNAQMLIAQHPGGADLRLTVGLYRDHSGCQCRIRYFAPAINGSSGAPCFNVRWKLYALHNAGYIGPKVNQGVPVWKILAAIRAQGNPLSQSTTQPALMTAVTPEGEPVLGRLDIAARVKDMLEPGSTLTTLVIRAPEHGGKTWTGRLIRSLVTDRGHDAFFFDAERFVADTPERFARRLVDEVSVAASDDVPPPPDTRQRARWIAMRLARWTRRAAVGAKGKAQSARTLWIILDRLDEINFTQETHDLLVALVADQTDTPTPVRFVLLGYGGDLASVPPKHIWRTELDLFSARAIRPFIGYALDQHGVPNDAEKVNDVAEQIIGTAHAWNLTTVPHVVAALKRYADWLASNRQKAIAEGEDQ